MILLHSLISLALSMALPDSGAPTAKAALSEETTTVNRPVQLTISILPGRVNTPPKVSADGLAITYAGQSIGIQTQNGQTTTSTTFTYVVTADHVGTFNIPSIPIELGTSRVQTEKLTLKVERAIADNGSLPSKKPYFAELIIPKDSAYVGEPVPIELRFYFDRRIWYEPYPQGQLPIIEGGDFVTKKYPAPTEKPQTINGRDYQVLVYKTAITGVKSGRLELQTAYQEFMIRVPVSRRSFPGTDDFFDQTPVPNPFDAFERKDVKIEAPGTSIEIKPLPENGKPASFAGAIGRFTMATSTQPTRTHVGDPISIKTEIQGLGSFDRMEAPTLIETQGWKTYQPSTYFTANDDLGLGGSRTFTYSVVPTDVVRRSPVVEFAYFDPEAEKYVVIRSRPVTVQIECRPLAGPDTTNQPSSPAMASPRAAPTPPLEVLDIQHADSAPVSFVPLIQRPVFWLLQGAPAAGLLALGAGIWFRNLQRSGAELRALRARRANLLRRLNESDPRVVLPAAVALLVLDCSLKNSSRAMNLSAEQALASRLVRDDLRRELDSLLTRNNRLVYGQADERPISEEERNNIKQLIRRWESSA
jgi:BatD DUF11 like domain